MCTIAYIKNRPRRVKQDIITYKVVASINQYLALSKCRGFYYILDNLYKVNITADIKSAGTVSGYADAEEYNRVMNKVCPLDPVLSISKGFHSYSSLERIRKVSYARGAIVKCIIPEGSKIITGIDKELIVSDQIIITDLITYI